MIERSVQFGESGHLVGTVTVPAAPLAGRSGVLLLNAGAVRRVGPHRINVKVARRAARLGLPAIRFDLSGLGDSEAGNASSPTADRTISDMRAAMDHLAAQTGVERFALFGICSGADNGLKAALDDPRLDTLILFDPYVFPTLRWRLRLTMGRLRRFGFAEGLALLLRRGMARRTFEDSVIDNYGRTLPPIGAFAETLRVLCDRGVSIRLVYSGSSVDLKDWEVQRRMLLERHGLAGRVDTVFMPDVDHIVTPLDAQRALLDRLDEWLAPLAP